MRKLAGFLLLICIGASSAFGQPLRPVYDARLNLKPTEPTRSEAELLRTTVKNDARQVWTDVKRCKKDFELVDATSGTFTAEQGQQRLFLYRFCTTGHGRSKNGIAVFEGGELKAHIVYSGSWESAVGALPDVNRNRFDEILVASGFSNMGSSMGSIRIIELGRADVQKLGSTRTRESHCGLEEAPNQPHPVKKARKLYVRPGSNPGFYRDTFVSQSCENEGWTQIESHQPVKLKSSDTSYDRLR